MPAARADIGTSEWLVMPGEVFISSRKGLRSLGADHHVGPAPAAAAAACGSAASVMRWISRSSRLGQAARAVVLHVVGEVLVLVVVGALGRGDAHHRQRSARRAPLPSTAQVTSSPSMNSSQSTSASYLTDSVTASCICGVALDLGHADRASPRAAASRSAAGPARRARPARSSRALHVEGRAHVLGAGRPCGLPDALGHDLVHRHARGHHARAGVGNARAVRARPAPCRPRRGGHAAR